MIQFLMGIDENQEAPLCVGAAAAAGTLGFTIDFRDGDTFRELIVSDHQKYGTIVREAGIHPG
jgi:hypothetical protein